MPYTDQDFETLKARVAAIDGIGLADPSEASLSRIYKEINGIKEIIDQVTLTIQALLEDISSRLNELEARLNQHLGS